MELDLWAAFIARPDIRHLDPRARMFLIELGVAAVDTEDLATPDGFVPDVVLLYMDWPRDDVEQYISDFSDRGWVTRFDDPPGWQINGWLDRPKPFRPGNPSTVGLTWGQRKLSGVLSRREQNTAVKRKIRERSRAENEPPSSPPDPA